MKRGSNVSTPPEDEAPYLRQQDKRPPAKPMRHERTRAGADYAGRAKASSLGTAESGPPSSRDADLREPEEGERAD